MIYKILCIDPNTGFRKYVYFEGTWYDLQEFIHENIQKQQMVYPVVFNEAGEIADCVSEQNFRYNY